MAPEGLFRAYSSFQALKWFTGICLTLQSPLNPSRAQFELKSSWCRRLMLQKSWYHSAELPEAFEGSGQGEKYWPSHPILQRAFPNTSEPSEAFEGAFHSEAFFIKPSDSPGGSVYLRSAPGGLRGLMSTWTVLTERSNISEGLVKHLWAFQSFWGLGSSVGVHDCWVLSFSRGLCLTLWFISAELPEA